MLWQNVAARPTTAPKEILSSHRCVVGVQLNTLFCSSTPYAYSDVMCRYDVGVDVCVAKSGVSYDVELTTRPERPLVLHWAVNEWQLAPKEAWPQGTRQACHSCFSLTAIDRCRGGPDASQLP